MTEIISSNESTVPSPSENINFEEIPRNVLENLSGDEKVESSDDSNSAGIAGKRNKNSTKRFSDSESDVDKENIVENRKSLTDNNASTDSDDYVNLIKQRSKKSRIVNINSDSESDTDQVQLKETQPNIAKEVKGKITIKRNKLREKFQNLLDSKGKGDEVSDKQTTHGNESNSDNGSTCSNDEEIVSINDIKKKIKEHTNNLKMAICDPDTSEDESSYPRNIEKKKKQQRRIKLTSPKPQRMSAKEAMENMQKIRSESNRMLREKEVSLPYHRPKALSLKDIMSRRKPAVSSDGKVLPIKMNEDQLRQYVLQLEQRQKEMIELCKSDSEEEEDQYMIADDKQKTEEVSPESSNNTTESNNKRSEILSLAENNGSSNSKINSEISIISTSKDMQKSLEIRNTSSNDFEVLEFNNTEISDISTDITNVQDKSEDLSDEMELVYKDSVEEDNETNVSDEKNVDTNKIIKITEQKENEEINSINIEEKPISADARDKIELVSVTNSENFAEKDSQLISLRFDTEKIDSETDKYYVSSENAMDVEVENNEFPDNDDNELDDINMEDIDRIIENADILQDNVSGKKINSPALVKDTVSLSSKPILMGAPGMVIDLDDGNDADQPKKLTGVELLKERFIYFAKLKTPEEMERAKEKRHKPGAQHQKLKHDLEEKIAEQRSLEWAKRLESEKEQQKEMDAIRGELSDIEDDIDKIEAKLEENESEIKASSSEEEENIEDDVLIEDKPRKKNPLVADEADESDVDDAENDVDDDENEDVGPECGSDSGKVNDESDEDSSDDEESSESEDEKETKPKKGRILKAFEDSDDEETVCPNSVDTSKTEEQTLEVNSQLATDNFSSQIDENDIQVHKLSDVTVPTVLEKVGDIKITKLSKSDSITESQDDDLQLAQVPKSNSEELFTSQESINKPVDNMNTYPICDNNDVDLGSQTFSIMTSNTVLAKGLDMDIGSQEKLSVISETQPFDGSLDAVVSMCSGSFSQNYIQFKPPSTQTQNMESQAIGEDILDMCTGKFYDNEFVQTDDNVANTSIEISQECTPHSETVDKQNDETKKWEGDILKSVLDELDEPEFESSKPMKYFFDGKSQNKENYVSNSQLKKKFVIDSDDDTNENLVASNKKKKKLKKKRFEKRALQISDDEDDEYSEQECDDLVSENGDVQNNEEERLVEYDSEENEIEVMPHPKKKRKVADFFEQEAELTSEDEWAGSGDEDEAGLDRMEREAGDDDTFHQGRLQAELGQIHMRDVLDQDKREVRLIQELLFEDGDLGGGGRQRKFRWRDADGEDVTGTVPDELADTQEEEFESEEQWRKQRHEREMFLRQLKSQDDDNDNLNVSVTRTTIIKANLLSRTMSSVLEEANNKSVPETAQIPIIPEKKITKDIPSPKKPFLVFQQNYHGSLLTRGRGALARLAALATPLAGDHDAPTLGLVPATTNRNFVFATITPEDKEPKVTKRKAEPNAGTPRLVKKMRTEDKKKQPKNSLLDHFKA